MPLDQSKNIKSFEVWFYFLNRNTAKARSKYLFKPSITMEKLMLDFKVL